MPPPHNLRDETLKLNEFASNIHSVADARRFIDANAELFADDFPPAWTTNSLRVRLAQAEYLTVTNPHKRNSEQHLADAWNTLLTTIDARTGTRVSAAEIHVLRETHFTHGRAMWDRGYRNFWLLPSIFAVQPDGTLAPACRVVESLRMLYDLDRFPETLREHPREHVETHAQLRHHESAAAEFPTTPQVRAGYLLFRSGSPQVGSTSDPVEAAARRDRAMKALTNTIETLLKTVLSA